METRYPLGEIEIKNGRLYLINNIHRGRIEIDITPVWHFFNEVQDYLKNPTPPEEKGRKDYEVKTARELLNWKK